MQGDVDIDVNSRMVEHLKGSSYSFHFAWARLRLLLCLWLDEVSSDIMQRFVVTFCAVGTRRDKGRTDDITARKSFFGRAVIYSVSYRFVR